MFLVDLDCWTKNICKTKQLYEAACGFLLSYAWLVRYESDFRIACEKGPLPDLIHWATWTEFKSEFLEHIDLQSLSGVSPKYQYGELRLSRRASENASYGFAIASLFIAAGTVLVVLLIWAVLFDLVSAQLNNRHVMKERKSAADSQRDPRC